MQLSHFLRTYAIGERGRLELCITVAGLVDLASRSGCRALAVGGSLVQPGRPSPSDVDCAILKSDTTDDQSLREYAALSPTPVDLFICSTPEEYAATLSLFSMVRGSDKVQLYLEIPLRSGSEAFVPPSIPNLRGLPTTHIDRVYRGKVEMSNVLRRMASISRASNAGRRVFLCYAKEKRAMVLELYDRLRSRGHAPWMDKKNLLGGQDWKEVIPNVIRQSDAFVACLSREFAFKRSFLQKEIRVALDVLDQSPPGQIFLIPARLEQCDIPPNLTSQHAINLYDNYGFDQLCRALETGTA